VRSAHADDLRPRTATTQSQLEPATGEDVEAGGGLGQHGGRPEWQVGDVRHEPQFRGPAGQYADDRERVQEVRHVGMVLNGHVVETRALGRLRVVQESSRAVAARAEKDAELRGVHGGLQRLEGRVTTASVNLT
jgi:hypothetical protein